MVEMKRTYRGYCCNSCGKLHSEKFPVWKIEVGIPFSDRSVQTTSISLCNECIKALQTKIEKLI